MQDFFTIGVLATKSMCNIQTIRYYEKIGLITKIRRTMGNQRLYNNDHLQRIIFIRHARSLGFNLDKINALLKLADQPQSSCHIIDDTVRDHLHYVEERISQLNALKTELERIIAACSGGTIANCRVIEAITDHSLCHNLSAVQTFNSR